MRTDGLGYKQRRHVCTLVCTWLGKNKAYLARTKTYHASGEVALYRGILWARYGDSLGCHEIEHAADGCRSQQGHHIAQTHIVYYTQLRRCLKAPIYRIEPTVSARTS